MSSDYRRGAPPGLPGAGHLTPLPVGQPAAGADWSAAPPVGATWRVLGGSAQLVTSNAVFNRQVYLVFKHGGLELYRIAAAAVQAASATVVYEFLPGQTIVTLVATYQPMFLPSWCFLDPRMTVGTTTTNLQAGDQWSNVVLLLEELETLPYAAAAGAQAPGAQARE